MSKLDDMLMANKSIPIEHRAAWKAQTKQQIKDLMLELIGEDEVRPASGPKRNGIEQGLRRTRNKQRAELRKKVEQL